MPNRQPQHLFLLMNKPSDLRVVRVVLGHDLQEEVTELFMGQAGDLRPETVDEVAFDGRYKADEGEILVIAGFMPAEEITAALHDPIACPQVHRSALEDQKICGLMLGREVEGKREAVFQAFQHNQLIRPGRLSLLMSKDTFERIDNPGLSVGGKADAQLDGDKLSFRSYSMVRRMLDLSATYKEATAEDLQQFFAGDCFDSSQMGALLTTDDQWIRRKVGLLMKNDLFERIKPDAVRTTGHQVGITVVVNEGKIQLPADKGDLKKLLKLLDEDFLQSLFEPSRLFETNSKREVS
jgi:hypothetical protein